MYVFFSKRFPKVFAHDRISIHDTSTLDATTPKELEKFIWAQNGADESQVCALPWWPWRRLDLITYSNTMTKALVALKDTAIIWPGETTWKNN